MEHTNGHGVLVVFGGREHLRFLGRDRCVAVDQACEHTAQSFDTQGQWCHVQQNNVFDVALQNTGLNSGTHGNNFVRVHTFVRLFAKEFGHFFDHAWHAGHTANQNDFVDVSRGQAGIFQRSLQGFNDALIRSPTRLSSLARVSFMTMCSG